MTTIEEAAQDWLEGCIRAFLCGKQNFKWITSIVNGSDPKKLREIVESIDGVPERKEILLKWIP